MSESDPLKKIKATLADQGNLEQFLKIINFYNQNYISASNLINLVEPLIDDKEQMVAFKSFIKYQEVVLEAEPVKYKGLEKIGSYKLLPAKYSQNLNGSSIAKEVINYSLVSVSTLESEDDTYVFRLKNFSEELLSRIVDERSEADLILDRLKFLIVKLEELYNSNQEGELGLHDIQMSSALVKETIRRIYDEKSSEVLESILTKPKKAIPIILKRLNKVFKEYMEKMREYKKHWRSILEEHYYKAYDNSGVNYRIQERNYLSHKFIKTEAERPIIIKVDDPSIFNILSELFEVFTRNHSSSGFRKPPIENQLKIFNSAIENFKKNGFSATIDFETYVLYYYIFILYSRFNEVKNLDLSPLSSNPVAVSINYQQEFYISDRYAEMITAAKSLMNKEIEATRFEEIVRKLTDCAGYKLYNLKKIMAKIEKQINYLIDEVSVDNKDDDSLEINYCFQVNEQVATLVKVDELTVN